MQQHLWRHTVVAVPEWDDVEVSRVEPGHVHRQVVGLGAAVDEVDAFQGVGQQVRQTFGVFMNFWLQQITIAIGPLYLQQGSPTGVTRHIKVM